MRAPSPGVARDPSGTSGLEWGTYSWNASTGALSLNTAINTDGQWGLSNSGITSATVIDNTLTFSGAEGQMSVDRLMSPPGSIVGSWYNNAGGGGSDQVVFTFLADGSLLVADKGTVANDPTGTSGIEWGSYTWDAATGAAVINILLNTDGQWGFASAAPETIHMTLQLEADALRVLVSDGDGGLLARLSPLIAPPAITGTVNVDTLTGTSAGESINALDANDKVTGNGGNDSIDGGAGIDTAWYAATRGAYSVTANGSGFVVSGASDGADSLTAVERLHFSDSSLALDLNGNAGMVAKILGAVFGAGAVSNPAYVGIGLGYADGGMSYESLMQLAINASAIGPAHTHAQLVSLLWQNVVGGTPPPADLANYTHMLDTGTTEGALGILAADYVLNTQNIHLTGLAQTGLAFI